MLQHIDKLYSMPCKVQGNDTNLENLEGELLLCTDPYVKSCEENPICDPRKLTMDPLLLPEVHGLVGASTTTNGEWLM